MTTLNAQFTDIVRAAGQAFSVQRWLEIEGIPYGYGNVTKDVGWFAARAAVDRLLGVKAYFKKTPDSFDAEVDVLDGLAKYMGQVDFNIVDVEGEQTLWCGAWDNTHTRELLVALSKTDVTVFYAGAPASSTEYPLGGGTIYIGNETIAYTAHDNVSQKFTGCTRGKYRSKTQAWKVGAIIGHKPYVMYGRRVWYYQTVAATGGASASGSLQAPIDGHKVLRFSGTVENLTMDPGDAGAYVLRCLSLEKEFTREVFRDLRTVRDTQSRGIVGEDYTKPGIRFAGDPGATQPNTADRLYSPDIHQLNEHGLPYFTDAEYFMFKVDDEFILFQSYTTSGSLKMVARGLMGTAIQEHRPGFSMQEVAICARYIPGTTLWEHKQDVTKFNSLPDATSTAQSDHPLIALLHILISTGDGDNWDGVNRNYDILPTAWGLGIPYDRIDVTGIVRLANATPDLVVNGYWDKAIGFGTFAKQCLAPFGFYGVTQLGDVWTVRRLVPPLPDDITRDFDSSHFISKQPPTWDANLLGLVQEVEYLYNHDVKFNTWTRNTIFINALGKQYAQGKGRRLKYDLPQLYEKGPTPIPGRPPLGGMPNVELMLQERLEFLKQGFTLPPPIITRRFSYDAIDVEPGDLIKLTDGILPRIQDGIRGISLQTMRVLRKTINDGSKTVELSLQDCGFGVGDFGYIAPSCKIRALASDSFTTDVIQLEMNEFTLPLDERYGLAQNDAVLVSPSGATYDWLDEMFVNIGRIHCVPANFSGGTYLNMTSYYPPNGGGDPWFGEEYPVVVINDDITAYNPNFGVGSLLLPYHNEAGTLALLTARYFTFMSDADEELLAALRLAFRFYP